MSVADNSRKRRKRYAELSVDPRRVVSGLNELTFVNVTTADTQVIQCNVSNKHGYVFANAYLNVHHSQPSHGHSNHSTGTYLYSILALQCFDAVGWAAGRTTGL